MRTKNLVVLSFLGLLAWAAVGCAVQKSKAPQISALTANQLNFATLVSQAQADYVQFFTEVGTLERAGSLTPDQVATLNKAGAVAHDALDEAGSLSQVYAATGNASIAQQIQAYLQQAAQAYAAIYQERTAMLAKKAGT